MSTREIYAKGALYKRAQAGHASPATGPRSGPSSPTDLEPRAPLHRLATQPMHPPHRRAGSRKPGEPDDCAPAPPGGARAGRWAGPPRDPAACTRLIRHQASRHLHHLPPGPGWDQGDHGGHLACPANGILGPPGLPLPATARGTSTTKFPRRRRPVARPQCVAGRTPCEAWRREPAVPHRPRRA